MRGHAKRVYQLPQPEGGIRGPARRRGEEASYAQPGEIILFGDFCEMNIEQRICDVIGVRR